MSALADARAVLACVRARFDAAVREVAAACRVAGRLDAARVEARQGECYELAWAAAELAAADAALAADAPAPQGDVDRRLALAFAAEAAVAVLGRLAALALDTGGDAAAVHALLADAELAALRRASGSSAALAALGADVAALAAQGGEIGAPALDESVAMAQAAFRRFAAEAVAPLAARIHREDLTVPEALLQPMRAMGLFGLSIPEAHGGHAPPGRSDALMMVAVTEALSAASLAAAGSLITRPEILTRALLAGGTPEQQAHWLPRIAAGDPLCAIAITEPDHGSDVAGLALRATRVIGGWRLDGAKTWCTFAGKAGLLMVVARTDPDRAAGHRGLSLFLVEKPSSDGHAFSHAAPGGGTLQGRAIPTIGYRGMHSFDLAFDGLFVPDSHVVGGEAGVGRGFYLTMTGMTGGRLQTAGRACGVMQAALAQALSYAQQRRVFGAPLADHALTRIKTARLAARYAACRRLTYAVAAQADGDAARLGANLAKLIACRSAELVTREALQIHGGMGYAEETAVSRYFVDARVLSIFEGAEETLALKVIARGLLDAAAGQMTHLVHSAHLAPPP